MFSISVSVDAFFMSYVLLQTILWFGLVALTVHLVFLRYFHTLSSIPGPVFAGITRLWLVHATLTRRRHLIEASLHEKYGNIVRIAPNELSISDPNYVHNIYRAHSQFAKSGWYSAVAPKDKESMNLLGESDMEKHRMQRRLIGPIFTMQAIKAHEDLMDRPILQFVEKMRRAKSAPQDLCKWMNILALDLLTEVTFSESPGYINAENDEDNSKDIDAFWQQISWVGLVPGFWQAYVWLSEAFASMGWTILPLKREASSLAIMKFFISRMSSPAASDSHRPSNLASSIALASKTHAKLTPSWAATITLHIVGAGFDTLGYTISCALMSVATMPGCQAELHRELDEAKHTNSLCGVPIYDQAAKLPYLTACINESLRLNPVIGMTLPRTVPPGGMMIGNQHIPSGTTVGMNPRVIHRNKDVFGEDANLFSPARYLDASPDQLHAMMGVNLAFGGPSRSCPGQYLAKVALWKIVAAIFLHFDVEILDDEEARVHGGGRREESFFVVKLYGVWMRLRSRTLKC